MDKVIDRDGWVRCVVEGNSRVVRVAEAPSDVSRPHCACTHGPAPATATYGAHARRPQRRDKLSLLLTRLPEYEKTSIHRARRQPQPTEPLDHDHDLDRHRRPGAAPQTCPAAPLAMSSWPSTTSRSPPAPYRVCLRCWPPLLLRAYTPGRLFTSY